MFRLARRTSVLRISHFWMGLWNDKPLSKHEPLEVKRQGWPWLDGPPYTWMNWHGGEPTGDFRAAISTSIGHWKDQDVKFKAGVICQKWKWSPVSHNSGKLL